MESIKKFSRKVWRNNRPKMTFTLHPDIVKVIRKTAREEGLSFSVVADEAFFAGFKAMGRI
jgi:hypothetical protein